MINFASNLTPNTQSNLCYHRASNNHQHVANHQLISINKLEFHSEMGNLKVQCFISRLSAAVY